MIKILQSITKCSFPCIKKIEIAVISANNSTSTFKLDVIILKRDLINWLTVIKQHPETDNTKSLLKTLQNDIKILNLITCGEIRGSEQRKEILKNRIMSKF